MEVNHSNQEPPVRLDHLIVGHGLAGCLLAAALERHGCRVGVMGVEMLGAASPISAGILNPVIGPKLNPPWQAEICLDAARKTYHRLELKHRAAFYKELPILRVFDSPDMASLWEKRRKRENELETEKKPYEGFFGPMLPPERLQREFSAKGPHGAGVIQGGGRLDVRTLLTASRQHLAGKGCFFDQPFRHKDLRKEGETAAWGNLITRKVIFCEGFRLRDNPWFSTLPFAPSRGDLLKLGPLPSATCLNAGTWISPQTDDSSLAGSTYRHHDLEAPPEPEGEAAVRHGLGFLDKVPATLDHLCGVRPTTTDRMPLYGSHPSEPVLALFNGFGSKASLLAPLCAELLADHLVHGTPIPKEMDLNRFPNAADLPRLE